MSYGEKISNKDLEMFDSLNILVLILKSINISVFIWNSLDISVFI